MRWVLAVILLVATFGCSTGDDDSAATGTSRAHAPTTTTVDTVPVHSPASAPAPGGGLPITPGDVPTGDGAPDCASHHPTTTVHAPGVMANINGHTPGGTFTVTVLEAGEHQGNYTDAFGSVFEPHGTFFEVRYRIKNDTQTEIYPTQFLFELTDGSQAWDDAGASDPAIDDAAADEGGDDPADASIGAGFSGTTRAVFDVPPGRHPSAMAWAIDPETTVACVGVPAS